MRAKLARQDANDRGATGYCRPEDLHVDRSYGEFAGGEGIRWCWNNTCSGGLGETLCVTETAPDAQTEKRDDNFGFNLLPLDGENPAEVIVTRLVGGDAELNSHDNLDIQPGTSNVYVIEDNQFGDIWACLPDGEDRNLETDGCVRVLSIRDPNAEPSGFIFNGTGQQPDELRDFDSNPVDGRTDDLIKITGFRVESNNKRNK